MKFQSNAQHNAYNQEWAYVYGRKFLLFLLAIGSILVTFQIGGYVGGLLAPGHNATLLVMQGIFVLIGYAGIDWVLANALASASTVSDKAQAPLILIDDETGEEIHISPADDQKGDSKRSVWIFAVLALITTIGLSLVSNTYISTQMAGDSHLENFNDHVAQVMRRDSALKSRAFNALQSAEKDEQLRIQNARAERKRLIDVAVATGSSSWQNDYYRHKDNPKAWFWTCRACPNGYKRYRERIKTAMREGDQGIAEARGYVNTIQQTLAPTLSYQMAEDSILLFVQGNILTLEQERASRKTQLNIILMVLTIGSGLLAFILTLVLREHRKTHTQQVVEDHVRPIMIVMDMLNRLGSGFADLIYTFTAHPFKWFKRNGMLKSYQIQDKRLTATPHGSVRPDVSVKHIRSCLNGCGTDISHKRSDAKFCSDACRMKYHNFVLRKKSGSV